MRLNLETKTKEQELVKAYLEENASETLAEKINNGTPFEKDGKTFINKKALDGFMKYASDEARKLASKGANSACVEDNVVYGWAVHYFEEDSIEGTLFNADGTEYKPAPKSAPTKVKKVEPKKPEERQPTLFDFMEPETSEPEVKDENDDDEDEQPSQEEIRNRRNPCRNCRRRKIRCGTRKARSTDLAKISRTSKGTLRPYSLVSLGRFL